ncbi:MAG: hypothetical protein ACE1ZS_04760, partial [Candidatus Poribacteria bacterium]
ELKDHFSGFHKVEHGGKILEKIDIEHVLSRPDTCASLRTLFAWCVKVLGRYPDTEYFNNLSLAKKYQLHHGRLSEITGTQLDNL